MARLAFMSLRIIIGTERLFTDDSSTRGLAEHRRTYFQFSRDLSFGNGVEDEAAENAALDSNCFI